MGCDIHCYIEYREKDVDDKNWRGFGGHINPGRNYGLFRLMAGIRSRDSENGLFKPKGLPEDIGHETSLDNFRYISDDEKCTCGESRSVTSKKAEYWVKSGYSIYQNNVNGIPTWVSNPDWHSHSWLSLSEYRQVLEAYKVVEQKDWEVRETERLELIKNLKIMMDVTEDSWLYDPCKHYDEPKYHAIEAVMGKFEEMGYESRLVFWFDN